MDERRITTAACECLIHCSDWDNPTAGIAKRVQTLIAAGWDSTDAREVGRRALEILDPLQPLKASPRVSQAWPNHEQVDAILRNRSPHLPDSN